MSSSNKLETIIGSVVVLAALSFLAFTYKVADVKKFSDTYPLKAVFEQVEGIIVGSDVMLSGIKIGSVRDLRLDTDTYRAVMSIAIKRAVKIPNDSSIRIVSNGLLGKKYVSVDAGASDEMFAGGDTIQFTQSSVNLETLIGKMIFNAPDKDKSKKDSKSEKK
ncbi:MAG: outer membrane lipid asymmetry maintenance protein MlaD [Alphaproteobacteria bacterium]|nr:outer membrane lipid asymmetry maintenance protein MlaD [Alphaproteobacteria bacterium]